jgi:hypothetical protein
VAPPLELLTGFSLATNIGTAQVESVRSAAPCEFRSSRSAAMEKLTTNLQFGTKMTAAPKIGTVEFEVSIER